jgi:hypothetical protein
MDPRSVCAGLAEALRNDVHAHPGSRVRVTLACFEVHHVKLAQKVREWLVAEVFAAPADQCELGAAPHPEA